MRIATEGIEKGQSTSSLGKWFYIILFVLTMLLWNNEELLKFLFTLMMFVVVGCFVARKVYAYNAKAKSPVKKKRRELQIFTIEDTDESVALRHVNARISDAILASYPDGTWKWAIPNPAAFVVKGGWGRIQTFNTGEYNFAEVHLTVKGQMNINMLKTEKLSRRPAVVKAEESKSEAVVVPIKPETTEEPKKLSDSELVEKWYNIIAKNRLDSIIADYFAAEGGFHFYIMPNGEVCSINKEGTTKRLDELPSMPAKALWGYIVDKIIGSGLHAEMEDDKILVSWA